MQYSAKVPISQPRLDEQREITATFIKLSPPVACDSDHGQQQSRTPQRASTSLDEQLQQLCELGEYQTATHRMLKAYGHDIRAFLHARTRSRELTDEVYSLFSEDLFKGLPGFAFRGKARSWMFTIARHALARHMSSRSRWHAFHAPLEQEDSVVGHPGTPRHEAVMRQRLRQLLTTLPEEDRFLLRQRVALSKDWREIAHTYLAEGAPIDPVDLERESARLRKRYQLLVARLRQALRQHDASDWP